MKPIAADDRQKLINSALRLLSFRPRSCHELTQRGLATIIPYLQEKGLVDDLEFSKWWVDQRCRFRPKGNVALGFELRQKRVSREIINSVLLPLSKEIALAKKLPLAKLRSRGFSPAAIDAWQSSE